eukprot:g10159.t1
MAPCTASTTAPAGTSPSRTGGEVEPETAQPAEQHEGGTGGEQREDPKNKRRSKLPKEPRTRVAKYAAEELREHNLLPPAERYAQSKALPVAERMKWVAKTYAENFTFFFEREGKCLSCCFLKENCICRELETLRKAVERAPKTTVEADLAGGGGVASKAAEEVDLGAPAALSATEIAKAPSEPRSVSFRFLIWMHYKERFRASNTGKLLLSLFPGSDIFLHGDPDETARFWNKLGGAARSVRPILLFPSEESVRANDIDVGRDLAVGCRADVELNECPADNEEAIREEDEETVLDVIVLDGTWNQARKMLKSIFVGENERFASGEIDEDLRFRPLHVKIDPCEVSRFSCRRQTQPDRICTLEAAAMLVDQLQLGLGLGRTKSCTTGTASTMFTTSTSTKASTLEKMYKSLDVLCNAMNRQSHKDTMVYVAPTKNHVGRNRMQKDAYGKQAFQ